MNYLYYVACAFMFGDGDATINYEDLPGRPNTFKSGSYKGDVVYLS